ncbi:hypothetical protein ACFQ1E_04410 [Sphingomonas canadensis]|uniref:Uncharacterized protein n=1 Tax=Sphingomonas canadensis TaxID=1219257 RepID=A0ABW3H811_9SPHN|nr:hypothetical protein [Sphingomonas canadensis]MCW3834513.1 hypothetical protein [Sphingomonas canadensis]
MYEDKLEWCQLPPQYLTMLVEEAGVQRLRAERQVGVKETAKRARAATETARRRGKSLYRTPAQADAEHAAAWERAGLRLAGTTWDQAPLPLPISGRDPDKPGNP